jgi:hypothetical protein
VERLAAAIELAPRTSTHQLPAPALCVPCRQVLLYLLRLAFGEAGLTWRLLGALALLAM